MVQKLCWGSPAHVRNFVKLGPRQPGQRFPAATAKATTGRLELTHDKTNPGESPSLLLAAINRDAAAKL